MACVYCGEVVCSGVVCAKCAERIKTAVKKMLEEGK